MKIFKVLFISVFLLFFISCGVKKSLLHVPNLSEYNSAIPEVSKVNDSCFFLESNYFFKNREGLWELKVSGDPLEIGLTTGALSQRLIQKQEHLFFDKIKELIPSENKQQFLIKFLRWYNRKIYKNVRNDFQTEIYGISKYASKDLDFVAPNFVRSLYLHGAHDIGHALQDLAMVGCSSLAVWGDKSEDKELLIGRNFDFYAGDEFAKDKIVAFVKPTIGYSYMSVTWGGMTGVVSGMNTQGLTVTINAGKSNIPLIAKTPISLVTKEIIQFASTINEAVNIVKKRKVFVSESILVASAKENKAVLIEVTPNGVDVFENYNDSKIICTNHFQSNLYKNTKKNLKQINESHSNYRYLKIEEWLNKYPTLNVDKMVEILRDKSGLNDAKLGYGNEKALNQLLGHHSIVFQPKLLKCYVSTFPYQLGEYVEYDLNEIFSRTKFDQSFQTNENKVIFADEFKNSDEFKSYELYRILEREIEKKIDLKESIDDSVLNKYQKLNPEFWKVYFLSGKYYYQMHQFEKATKCFELSLIKVVTTVPDKKLIEKYLKKSKNSL